MKNFIMKNKGKILFTLAIAILIALVSVYTITNLPKKVAIEKKEENYPKAIAEQTQSTESYTWTQDKTNVTNGEITLEVGSKITGYEANGVTDWYVLGAENGKLLLTTNVNTELVTLYRISSNINGISTLNSKASAYKNSVLASNARAINVADINRVTGYNPSVNAVDYGKNNYYWYGNRMTYKFGSYRNSIGLIDNIQMTGTKCPTEAKTYKTNFNRFYYPGTSTSLRYFTSGSQTFTSTLYEYYPQTLSTVPSTETSINGSSLAYNLLFANTSGTNTNTTSTNCYWLANNYIQTCYGYILWRSFWSI